MTITGPGGYTATGTTDSSGNYSVTVTALGDYTASASYTTNLVLVSTWTFHVTSASCGTTQSTTLIMGPPSGHVCCSNTVAWPTSISVTTSAGTFTGTWTSVGVTGWGIPLITVNMPDTLPCSTGFFGQSVPPDCNAVPAPGGVPVLLSVTCGAVIESWWGGGCDPPRPPGGTTGVHHYNVQCASPAFSCSGSGAVGVLPITLTLPATGSDGSHSLASPISGSVVIDY